VNGIAGGLGGKQMKDWGNAKFIRSTTVTILLLTLLSTAATCQTAVQEFRISDLTRTTASEPGLKECLREGQRILGENAEVLKCGFLNQADVLESVAALKRPPFRVGDRSIVSRLVILRKEPSGWRTALNVSREIQNGAGFLGIDYLDDASPYWGYSVLIENHRADGKPALVLSLAYMANENDMSEVPVDITWNPAVHRYQEFSLNYEPFGFKPEIKNPPHKP